MTVVPEEILRRWRDKALGNLERQRKHHLDQQWGRKHAGEFEDCWWCQRQRAVCKSKVRHESIDSAWEHGVEAWYRDKSQLVPYTCFWSEGLHWHVRTARDSTDRRKLRKRIVRRLVNPNMSV